LLGIVEVSILVCEEPLRSNTVTEEMMDEHPMQDIKILTILLILDFTYFFGNDAS